MLFLSSLLFTFTLPKCNNIDINILKYFRDEKGRTGLFLSVSGQHCEAAEVLLEAGADLGARDLAGVEVRQLARRENMLALLDKYS